MSASLRRCFAHAVLDHALPAGSQYSPALDDQIRAYMQSPPQLVLIQGPFKVDYVLEVRTFKSLKGRYLLFIMILCRTLLRLVLLNQYPRFHPPLRLTMDQRTSWTLFLLALRCTTSCSDAKGRIKNSSQGIACLRWLQSVSAIRQLYNRTDY